MRLKKGKAVYKLSRQIHTFEDFQVKANGAWFRLSGAAHTLYCAHGTKGWDKPQYVHFDKLAQTITLYPIPDKNYYARLIGFQLVEI